MPSSQAGASAGGVRESATPMGVTRVVGGALD